MPTHTASADTFSPILKPSAPTLTVRHVFVVNVICLVVYGYCLSCACVFFVVIVIVDLFMVVFVWFDRAAISSYDY